MRCNLMIAALALSTASFMFAEKKPKTTPSSTDPAATESANQAKKGKGKKHHKEHQAEQKPATN